MRNAPRIVLAGLLSVCALLGSTTAQSQAPMTVVVPFPAGGTLDFVARLIAQKMQDQTGEVYIVDNRPGATGMIGAKYAAKSKPDGKTWLFSDQSPFTVNPLLYPKDPAFMPDKDLAIVRGLALQFQVLVVNPNVPVKTLAQYVDYAKRNEINYASGGIGSGGHLAMEYFGSIAGIRQNHIAYKGGPPSMNDLVAGQVSSGFVILPQALPFIRAGKLVPIVVSSKQRTPLLPNVPTVIESGYPGFEVEQAYFVMLPSGTPPDVVKKIDGIVLAAISDPVVQEKIRAAGLEPSTTFDEPAAMKWIAGERDKWGKVIREKNIRGE